MEDEIKIIIIAIILLSLFTGWFYLDQQTDKTKQDIISDVCEGENEFFVQSRGCIDLEEELEEFRLSSVLPLIGGGGKVYSGIIPVTIDNLADTISLSSDFNELYVSWNDGNIAFVRQIDGNIWYNLVSDTNNIGRIYYETIPDWNTAILYSVDWNGLGITDDVNSWIYSLTYGSSDFNFFYLDDQNSSDINMGMLGTPTYQTLQDWFNTTQSSGRIGTLTVTDNGDGSLNIGAGTGIIKQTDSCCGETVFFDWDANANVELFDGEINHVYVDYNSGYPTIRVTLDELDIDGHSTFELYHVYRDGTDLQGIRHGSKLTDFQRNLQERLHEGEGHVRATGLITSEGTGNLNIAITAGKLWAELIPYNIGAFDSNSDSNSFTYWYRDGGTGWTEVTDINVLDNANYDDDSGILQALTPNRYGVHWIYLCECGKVYVVYGQEDYKLAEAQGSAPPASLPTKVSSFGFLVARIIIQEGTTTFLETGITWDATFPISTVQSHNELADLQGGTAGEYYHLTSYLSQLILDFNLSIETSNVDWNGWINSLTFGSDDFNNSYISWQDGNQNFWKEIDLNWYYTNKLNLFDLNVGNDLNVGRDLNVFGTAKFHSDANIHGNLYGSNDFNFFNPNSEYYCFYDSSEGRFACGGANTVGAIASVAFGQNNKALNSYSGALWGLGNTASGDYAMAGGNTSEATANYSIAIGDHAKATKESSIAIGYYVSNADDYSVALGTDVNIQRNLWIGNDANVLGDLNVFGSLYGDGSNLTGINATDSNYATAGIINPDYNSFNIDLNVHDNNFIGGSSLGRIDIAGDENKLYIGNNPADRMCIVYEDGNLFIGAC